MKKFVFSLDRVLDWRRTQVRREEAKLEGLYAERSAIDAHRHRLWIEREQAQTALQARGQVTREDLVALDAFEQYVAAENGRMIRARESCERQIAVQIPIVVIKRRDVKLLEELRQRRLASWLKDVDREISQDAEESHLAKWNREHA